MDELRNLVWFQEQGNLKSKIESRIEKQLLRKNQSRLYIWWLCRIESKTEHILVFLQNMNRSQIPKKDEDMCIVKYHAYLNMYLTIIPRARVWYELIGSQWGA